MKPTLRHLLVIVGAVGLCSNVSAAQSRLFSCSTGDATIREWNPGTGAYMSNVLHLLNGDGAPLTDQSEIEFYGCLFYSIAENDPRIRQFDITGRFLRDFAYLESEHHVGFATDGNYFYTIARNDSTIRKYELSGHYLGDAGQLRDSRGPLTSQIALATDGQFFYTIAANDWRIRRFDLTGQYVDDFTSFNRAGTPDGNNTGIAIPPPLASYTNTTENLIVNGSFEVPALLGGYFYMPADVISPWHTSEDFIEVWNNFEARPSADGRQHVEILAQSASTTIWQTVPTIANEDYALTFYHTPRPGVLSSLTVTANGQVLGTFPEDGSALTEFKWLKTKLNFTASSSLTTIAFNDTSTVGSGTHLDNVVLQRLPLSTTLRVSEVEICWETVTNKAYQIQYRSTLTSDQWLNLQPPISGNGTALCVKDSVPAEQPQRFYRVMTMP
jgi:hypothetical protein